MGKDVCARSRRSSGSPHLQYDCYGVSTRDKTEDFHGLLTQKNPISLQESYGFFQLRSELFQLFSEILPKTKKTEKSLFCIPYLSNFAVLFDC